MSVELNQERCEQIGRTLRNLGIPEPIEPWSVLGHEVDFDLATLNLILVAICHQTQTLEGIIDGKQLRGWDYLQSCLLNWAQKDQLNCSPDRLRSFTIEQLREILNCGDQLSDIDLTARASFICDCGKVLTDKSVNSFSDIYAECDKRIDLLLKSLTDFSAYRDPVRKKSLFLLGLNSATCGWTYRDHASLDPPVDYHEVRGHLRIGTVRIVNDQIRNAISNGKEVDTATDIAIRKRVTDAIRLIRTYFKTFEC